MAALQHLNQHLVCHTPSSLWIRKMLHTKLMMMQRKCMEVLCWEGSHYLDRRVKLSVMQCQVSTGWMTSTKRPWVRDSSLKCTRWVDQVGLFVPAQPNIWAPTNSNMLHRICVIPCVLSETLEYALAALYFLTQTACIDGLVGRIEIKQPSPSLKCDRYKIGQVEFSGDMNRTWYLPRA